MLPGSRSRYFTMAARKDPPPAVSLAPVVWGCIAAVLLLCLFGYLKLAGSPVIDLPAQWLWVSLVPILIGLILGRFINKLELPGGIKVETLNLPYYAPTSVAPSATRNAGLLTADTALRREYVHAMKNARSLFLVHVFQPSKTEGQKYDVSVYLMRDVRGDAPNQVTGFDDVEKAEFDFGDGWPGIFPVNNEGGHVGVNTSAWGQFLAVCRVTFKTGEDGEKQTAILHRYIDFEMASRRS
jgi:hypothetical protein